MILHGGDLADGGPCPAEVIDQIRDLGWTGVMGNADEMLYRPESLTEFAAGSSAPSTLWQAVRCDRSNGAGPRPSGDCVEVAVSSVE